VQAVHVKEVTSFADAVALAKRVVKEQKLGAEEERFVMTAGVPFGKPGTTNILRVAEVE
jgi:pyruvate kinase